MLGNVLNSTRLQVIEELLELVVKPKYDVLPQAVSSLSWLPGEKGDSTGFSKMWENRSLSRRRIADLPPRWLMLIPAIESAIFTLGEVIFLAN